MLPLKYLSNLENTWNAFNYSEISLQLKWPKDYFLVAGTAVNPIPRCKITDTKLYVSVITFSTHDNVKLHKQL